MGDDTAGQPPKSQEQSPPPATEQTDATEATPKKGAARLNPRASRIGQPGWRAPTPARIVELRVATVARAIIDGLGRANIQQATAKAQHEEAAKRDKARAAAIRSGQAAEAAEEEARKLVPILWGDEPIPERTMDAYIRRAKDAIGDEGKRLSRQREYVLGMQLARCNEVYQAAYKASRFTVCVQIIREVNEMFGIREAIKIMLLGAGGGPVQTEDVTKQAQNLSTDEGRARAISHLIQTAAKSDPGLAPIFARFASAVPLGAGALDPAPAMAPESPSSAKPAPQAPAKAEKTGRGIKRENGP